MTENGLVIEREYCDVCGKCVAACPTAAREMLGRIVTRDELLAELLKDRVYYEKSGGGVTLSGGEPTFQPDFAEALLRGLKEMGILTAIDTCGLTSTRTFDRLLPYTDLVLFDLKFLDPNFHRKFTGVDNQQILENLAYIQNVIQHQPRQIELWIRTPLIPGATDTNENLTAIGKYLSENLIGTIGRWELCAFNNLCREQYIRLGLDWEYATSPLMTQADLLRCEQIAKSAFNQSELVIASGATRQEDPIWE
jgi:pyruvate formate lyase activating enzyme